MDLISVHFVGKKAVFGAQNRVFLKYVFSYKMTFLRPSDQFSLGSKWFWYPQNDKMYTLGPTESPNGVRKGPRRAKNGPQDPTGPIRAYFGLFWGGGRPKIFLSPFGPKKAKIFFQNFFICIISTPKGSGTLKNPKLTPGAPHWTPFWPILWAKRLNLG